MKKYYKVVTKDLQSLGLRRNPNIMTFPVDEWVYEPKGRIDYSKADLGGIWVAQTLSGAKGLVRYMKKKNVPVKFFECEIGNILYENSYRVKTDKVKLMKQYPFQ